MKKVVILGNQTCSRSHWIFLGYHLNHMSYSVDETERATREFSNSSRTMKLIEKETCNPLGRSNKLRKFKR